MYANVARFWCVLCVNSVCVLKIVLITVGLYRDKMPLDDLLGGLFCLVLDECIIFFIVQK